MPGTELGAGDLVINKIDRVFVLIEYRVEKRNIIELSVAINVYLQS